MSNNLVRHGKFVAVSSLAPILLSLSAAGASAANRARVEHARELLGKHYKRSLVRAGEGIPSPAGFIERHVEEVLPRKWKRGAGRLAEAIIEESARYQLDPLFVMAVIRTESSFIPSTRGSAGEIGLMHVLPATADWIARRYKLKWEIPLALADPVLNVRIGTAYLDYLREDFDSHGRLYVSAYNMGPTNVRRALRKKIWPKDYASRVMQNYVDFYGQMEAFRLLNDRIERRGAGRNPASLASRGTRDAEDERSTGARVVAALQGAAEDGTVVLGSQAESLTVQRTLSAYLAIQGALRGGGGAREPSEGEQELDRQLHAP